MISKLLIAFIAILLMASIAIAGSAYVPPDLSKVSEITVIISGPTPPSQEIIDLLVSYGILEANILWYDTSGL